MSELRSSSGFDLIVAFGLMHHVPSSERRRALLAAGVEHLRLHGLLAVSFWQFGELERFRRRFLAWDALPVSVGRIDANDLEEGDHLLAWGNSGAARYCHHTSPIEADELIRASGGRSAVSFRADGESQQLNLYHLIERVA